MNSTWLAASRNNSARRSSHQLALLALSLLILSSVSLIFCTSNSFAISYGVTVPEDNFASPEDWDAIQDSGADLARVQFEWYHQKEYGGWSSTYDKYVEYAARRGITILPYFYGRDTKNQEYYNSPSSWNGYLSDFVSEAVHRYGYNGTFWATHNDVPYHPIGAWEVWNEPNTPQNSPSQKVSGEAYAEFFIAAANAIRAAQNDLIPGQPTSVLIGGLYQPNTGTYGNVSAFLTGALGMKNVSGINNAYSGLGLHPYGFDGTTEASRFAKLQSNVNEGRNALNAMCASCSNKTIWITEFGWPTWGTGQPLFHWKSKPAY